MSEKQKNAPSKNSISNDALENSYNAKSLDNKKITNNNKSTDNKKITAWERVEIARNPNRKTSLDYIENIFDEFIELHGDRVFRDDPATICGLARIGNKNFTIIAEQKGRNTKENIKRNFGMPNPESYRKAIRLMKQADKFNRPIITFVDTKGAYPGIGAEQRGQRRSHCKINV